MKKSFLKSIENRSRNLVIHNITEDTMSKINEDDVVFFDDCTYNQYKFITKNLKFLEKNIIVIGFSTNLFRKDGEEPITNLTTKQLHDGFHGGNEDFTRGFMTLCEINELVERDNIYLALHGNDHLFLENEDFVKRVVDFRVDVEKSISFLKANGLMTNIFVYPYDFTDCSSNDFLERLGFSNIYPSKNNGRIYVEEVK